MLGTGLYFLVSSHALWPVHVDCISRLDCQNTCWPGFVCLGQCPASLRHKICAVEDGWPLFDGIKGSLVGVPLWERSMPPSFPGPKSDGT